MVAACRLEDLLAGPAEAEVALVLGLLSFWGWFGWKHHGLRGMRDRNVGLLLLGLFFHGLRGEL